MYLACSCPQGEPCVCYCPYEGGAEVYGGAEPFLADAEECADATGCPNCAVLESLQGTVGIKRGNSWCLATNGLVIGPGDKIFVQNFSMATVRYFNGGKVDMDQNSMFAIESISTTEEGATEALALDMVEGAFHFLIDEKRIEQFEVRMDTAVVGVEGTEFLVDADSSQITVKVIEGNVTFANDASDAVVALGPGEYSTASKAGGPPSAPASFNPDSERQWWPEDGVVCCGSAFILAVLLLTGFLYRTR